MFEIDESYTPNIIIKFKNTIENDTEFTDFLNYWLNLYTKNKDFSLIFDTREINKVPNIKYCFQMALFIYQLKQQKHTYLQKSAIIINDDKIKHLLNFIFSLQSPIADVYIYNPEDITDIYNIFEKFDDDEMTDYILIKSN